MNKLQRAMDPIRADQTLKQRTADLMKQEILRRQASGRSSRLRLAAVLCVFLICFSAFATYSLYCSPVSYISIDVNPSVELALNYWNRVVRCESYNPEGERLLQSMKLENLYYTEALDTLFANEEFLSYLNGGGDLNFTVVSDQEEVLLEGIQNCHGYSLYHASCYSSSSEDREEAHHHGLSTGKYRAYLELSQYDPSITPEDCAHMSMRQLRERIAQYTGDSLNDNPESSEPDDSPGNGSHSGNGGGSGPHHPDNSGQKGQGHRHGQSGS